jgi:hypothetical protein
MTSTVPGLSAIALELEGRQLRLWCKTRVVYRLWGDIPGSWRTLRAMWSGHENLVRQVLRERHGDHLAEIANERFL